MMYWWGVARLPRAALPGGSMKPYTCWIDFGYEGWRPRDFETYGELRDFILKGEAHGLNIRFTEELPLTLLPSTPEVQKSA
jgi:hypothetical protein